MEGAIGIKGSKGHFLLRDEKPRVNKGLSSAGLVVRREQNSTMSLDRQRQAK